MIPRPEFPEPLMQRRRWKNLNGTWQFEVDAGGNGLDCDWQKRSDFSRTILVPYPPESQLSQIHETDFMPGAWYRRSFDLAKRPDGLLRLHFGAVDYHAYVWINGVLIGEHVGGYVPFALEISAYVHPGKNTIVVYAQDDCRTGLQPSGKQSRTVQSRGAEYTRTTGIWQTVWLEWLPQTHVESIHYECDIHAPSVTMTLQTAGQARLSINIYHDHQLVGQGQQVLSGPLTTVTIPLSAKALWTIGDGQLYTVDLQFGDDHVQSYFGLREVHFDHMRFMLNDQPVFQRLVLDQGYYPDGVYTAPSDADFINDIHLTQQLGFNGARLHQKIVDPRLLYHCDRLGLIVWAEMPSWGLDLTTPTGLLALLPEWEAAMKRDQNHPCIITWCPFNETWDDANHRPQDLDAVQLVYHTTKQLDASRPVVDTSGHYHRDTDFYDVHDYTQDAQVFANHFDRQLAKNGVCFDEHDARQHYQKGLPLAVSEYGGIKWAPDAKDPRVWGYGQPASPAAFITQYQQLTTTLLKASQLFGFCYTQLYDVEQERTGLLDAYRRPKFDLSEITQINQSPAAIE